MKILRLTALAIGLAMSAGGAAAQCTLPGDANAFASQLAAGLNAQRRANGLGPLQYNEELGRAAMRHACDMQANGFFDHHGSDGSNHDQRVQRTGYRPCFSAENLAFGYPQPATVVDGWMHSPGHRRNMLAPQARDFGIGLAAGRNGPIAVLVLARSCGA